ncbi:MAG: cbb3-type cytochrome c oxidase subunit 3 [Magnetococcales bacterium]|nr:cbb3-type cytochrome c oxidase subunit 3 [Magnetococcales bacterium]MBF0415335.1 cbb3-type cytochrome c oxidase subunit 3 [Magnetococcales bacterium]MBF0420186.1 cbb3-type cytochrome c oxidase subunit 3 [Magnetococcales bacterium]
MNFDTMIVWSKLISLVLFFLVFAGVVIWAYWPGNRVRFEREGRKILEEES